MVRSRQSGPREGLTALVWVEKRAKASDSLALRAFLSKLATEGGTVTTGW